MTRADRWGTAGRLLLGSSALVILAYVPDLVARADPRARPLIWAVVAALIVVWAWFCGWAVVSRSSVARALAAVAITALLAALTAIAPPGRDGLLLAALAVGVALPMRLAAGAVAAVALLAGAIQLAHGVGPLGASGTALNDFIVGLAGMAGRLLVTTNRELEAARDEIARLAVGEERLRFARDLHDLLGQDLTLAVLKSELVARDLPPETPAALLEAQAEVAITVRKALDDVRTAVAGYRQPAIGTELAAARAALAAAGITLVVEDNLGSLPPVQEAVLAWTLREGVTNVLRHSSARRCVLRLRRELVAAVVDIEDDGRGGEGRGNGLSGIAERVAGVGGTFEAARHGATGYRVRVSVPLAET